MNVLDSLISIIAPFECLGCGKEKYLLCPECGREKLNLPPSVCFTCGIANIGGLPCDKCRPNTALSFVWIRSEYNGLARAVVQQVKFGLSLGAAKDMALACLEVIPYLPEDIIFCPVPAATTRVRQRGFDQSELLARQISKLYGRSHSSLLVRVGQTRQMGASRSKRLTQLKSGFRTVRLNKISGAYIVLIDDVVTTGATLEAAARCLIAAGAAQVSAVVFARTM